MPTYDYECDKCGHVFEVFEKPSQKRIKNCPECKKGKAKRLLGAGGGIIFKGSGFYITDSKGNSGEPQPSKKEKKTARKEKKDSSTKSEQKK
ncbi:MAG: zinc ribbon domain-containing protein [Planctomycetota bacterium]|nr:zinc ribbon domain-containing protein [Planctomycetota bacterium]